MSDHEYSIFERQVAEAISHNSRPVFRTDADPDRLWGHYIMHLPEEERQHYNCRCCQHFVKRYAGLVTVGSDGKPKSLFGYDDPPPFFQRAAKAVREIAEGSKIAGAFVSDDTFLGTHVSPMNKKGRTWTHLYARNPAPFKHGVLSASQKEAALLEDYAVLVRAFGEYDIPVVDEAIRVLKADVITRPEKALAIAEWYRKVLDHKRSPNLLWMDVVTAPAGFAHVKNTVIATLMDDIKAGMSFEVASRRWAEKMHPLQYQRSTKAVTEGAIEAAERIVEKMGLQASFERRYAKLEEVQGLLWKPSPVVEEKEASGVFGHLKARKPPAIKPMELPAREISWARFSKDILPTARTIEVDTSRSRSFFGLVAAVNPDSPPILQWDHDPRNQVSWYFYHGGSSPSQWSISSGWVQATGVFLSPPHWKDPEGFKQHAKFVGFALEGCQDSRSAGLCLFPEILKSELREIRAVVEANNRSQHIQGAKEGTANGLAFHGSEAIRVRVNGTDIFNLVRWE